MSWTSPTDVTDAWIGDDTPTDLGLIQTWINKAEREIRFRVPDLQSRLDIEAGEIPPVTALLEDATDVVTAMVIRKFRNPEGFRQRNVTTGPFSEQQTYAGNDPGELGMLDTEVDRLSGATTGSSRAFVVDTIPTTSRFSESNEPPPGNPFGWYWP